MHPVMKEFSPELTNAEALRVSLKGIRGDEQGNYACYIWFGVWRLGSRIVKPNPKP